MNTITDIFQIQYPIVQGGMIWCSGWELASAVSNAGGLGLIGSGSMTPEILRTHIQKCHKATTNAFGVNIPLIFSHAEVFINMCVEERVPVVFTSAGNPVKWTSFLKQNGIKVVHVVANVKGALKSEEAGVDAVVAEGFEAGGHNGKEETSTMVLIPMVRKQVNLPLIAAGGIATGRAILAAFSLGAQGVQIGSRFAASVESSAHPSFKQKIIEAKDGDTQLCMKKLIGVRLLKNKFYKDMEKLEAEGATVEAISELLGRGRARKGMFEGDTDEGELEIGQVSGLIDAIKPVSIIIQEIIKEYNEGLRELVKFGVNKGK